MKQRLLLAFILAALTCVSNQAKCDDKPGVQQTARLDVQVKAQMGYLLYLPKDYEKRESWPILLFLHGAGERGDA